MLPFFQNATLGLGLFNQSENMFASRPGLQTYGNLTPLYNTFTVTNSHIFNPVYVPANTRNAARIAAAL